MNIGCRVILIDVNLRRVLEVVLEGDSDRLVVVEQRIV